MNICPLPDQPAFGAEIIGMDLADVSPTHQYPQLRALFEEHSLLLFRKQTIDNDAHNSHQWQSGDVPIWDERAILHRGQPYDQVRNLSSICVSAGAGDGLESMKPNSVETL